MPTRHQQSSSRGPIVAPSSSYAPVPTQQTRESSSTPFPNDEPAAAAAATASRSSQRPWSLIAFLVLIGFDVVSTLILLFPIIPGIAIQVEGQTASYRFDSSLLDLAWMAVVRIAWTVLAVLVSYYRGLGPRPEFGTLELYHANGEKKTREELEHEMLEEPLRPWLRRFASRPAFGAEMMAVLTQAVATSKCLARMNVEIGIREDKDPQHAWFWFACLVTAVVSSLESAHADRMCQAAGERGKKRNAALLSRSASSGLLRRIGSQLTIPLLSSQHGISGDGEELEPGSNCDVERGNENGAEETGGSPTSSALSSNFEDVRGVSDITGDSNYKATWQDLLATCYPDLHLICLAFVFLLLAAVAQVFIPKFLGKILDALTSAFADQKDGGGDSRHKSMFEIPGFLDNVKLLVLASVLAGVFAGIRGSVFTVVGGRVNVRLRIQLMDSLLAQDIGFFDVTKTGDITSRLSSDTTLVGDQVSLNVNVFLRSLVQAIGVLLFMFLVSWQLSILAFISVPLITLFSRWYGEYVRSLTKLMQKKLADGNSVCEAALGSMSTVRVFDAAEAELSEFETCMKKYLELNTRSAIAYCGYATFVTSLPQLVFAVVVFYGGLLVRNGDITSGQLVSFLLYLSSLSDAFSSIGYVFSSLTQAVGAADKVFELMHRKPRLTRPTRSDPPPPGADHAGVLGIKISKTREQRTFGLWPEACLGGIEFQNVELYYPARPQRKVLDGLSLDIPPGSVVALVGESGGGKSSITNLIEHLYEQSGGRVLIDGIPVHELAPSWLSKNVSIVSQTPTLFGRSIRRNIMYGLEGTPDEPSQEEIEAAARLANADKFIENMPQKYDTEVGERGVQLSGGQRQRIAIARALVRKPKILLLDEATSALDAESEHYVQKAIDDMLNRGKAGMTVIIIAHRLSTVRSADSIIVIKNGNVVEQGSHDALIADPDGFYSSLIRRQLESQRKLDGANVDTSLVTSNGDDSKMEDATGSFLEGESADSPSGFDSS